MKLRRSNEIKSNLGEKIGAVLGGIIGGLFSLYPFVIIAMLVWAFFKLQCTTK